ncbi:RHS repeat domain-containing protein [Pseudomonas hormoni]
MPTGIFTNAHTGTPTLRVSEARGLVVRDVLFYRREVDDPIDTRVTEQRFDAVGRLVASRDPYLFDLAKTDEATPFNLRQTMSLSGVALATDSVDAGWRVGLQGEAGQSLERWDGRGSHSLTQYDELLRPTAIRERGQDVAEHTLERFTYADASAEAAAHNLCGLLIRHDDPAGTVHVHDQSLAGGVLSHTRHFLRDTEAPDWPLEVAEREALLESGDGATTLNAYSANSEPWSQTDALGNRQAFTYTIDGQLKNTRLTLAGDSQTEKLLVSDLRYNATGQLETETAGNGVITRHRYDEADGRLTQLSAHKADGTPLQDLNYLYDPVGNVLSIEDAAQPIRYFNNQRIEPIKTYRYDTLNQLICASGCEAKTGRGGPALPDFQPLPPDPSQIANYTQTYHYDAGGNLLDLVHVGAQAHGRTLTRSRYSNRCLPERDNRPPTEDELANGFDANGNLRELQVGQSMVWSLRNQLREVRPVMREEAEDDRECYIYDGGGQRVRKVRSSLTNSRTVIHEVRYLPGVEIRSHSGTGEILHIITATAGSNSVQVLHWAAKQPDEVPQDQVRYCLVDHLKSIAMELDQSANKISQESYYPFGSTAYWAGRNATEVKYKSLHYSGRERDATGLFYFEFRYYFPWLQRWINPDPAGYVDGTNLFAMVGNSPAVFFDQNGKIKKNSNEPDMKKHDALKLKKEEFYSKNHQSLQSWINLPENLSLVHTLKINEHRLDSELLRLDANSVLSSWNAISTSLVNFDDRQTHVISKPIIPTGEFHGMIIEPDQLTEYLTSKQITYGEIAFKLEFEASNILGTFPHDLGFQNHAGASIIPDSATPIEKVIERAKFSEVFFAGKPIIGYESRSKNTYYEIVTPEELLNQQLNVKDENGAPVTAHYNEVIITGKEGVSLHMGMPTSKKISVSEIIILPMEDVRMEGGRPIYSELLKRAVGMVRQANPNIKISIK